MGDSRDLVVDSTTGPLAYAKEQKDLLDSIKEAAAKNMMEIAMEAGRCGPMTDEEAVSLTPRQRRIRAAADKCQSEAPAWLMAAMRFNEACNRRDADARDLRKLNITQNNYINLPPPLAPAAPEDVKIVDIEQIKGDEDEE